MKTLLIISLLAISKPSPNSATVKEVRDNYVKAVEDKDVAERLYKKLKDETTPLKVGYRGAIQTILAKHYVNPFSKWSYFQDGSEELDESIKKMPNDPELRFLRFSIQTNAPSFLGYNSNIYEDKDIIISNLAQLKFDENNEMRQLILDYLLETSYCTLAEKEKIRATLASN